MKYDQHMTLSPHPTDPNPLTHSNAVRTDRYRGGILTLLLYLLLALAASPAFAAKIADAGEISARIDAAKNNAALDEATRKQLIDTWQQALDALEETEAVETSLTELQQTLRSAPSELERIKKQLAEPAPTDPLQDLPKHASLESLEQLAQQEAIRLNNLRDKMAEAEHALSEWETHRRQLRNLIDEDNSRIEKLHDEIDNLKESGDDNLATARLAALTLQEAHRQAGLKLHERQLAGEKLLTELRKNRLELARHHVQQLERRIAALSHHIETLRQSQGTEVVAQARQTLEELGEAPEPLRQLAETNIALSEELNRMLGENASNLQALQQLRRDIADLETSEKSVQTRLDVFGATDAIGRMLRKRLEQVRSIRRSGQTENNRELLNALTDRQIDIDEQREQLRDLDAMANTMLQALPPQLVADPGRRSALHGKIRKMLAMQKDLLASLADVYQQYSSRLLELAAEESNYSRISSRFEAFIRGKLFWMRNTTPVNFKHLEEKLGSAKAMLSPTRLKNSLRDIENGFHQRPFLAVAGLLLSMLVLMLQPVTAHRITEIGRETSRLQKNRYHHTLLALWYTALHSAGWPLLLGFSGWWLGKIPSQEAYTTALSEGLYTMATVLFTVTFLRQLCRPDGLAHRHFRWPNNIRRQLWKELRWLKWATAPLSFLIAFTLAVEFTPLIPAIGRPALVAMMLALVVFTWRMLNAASPITTYLQLKRPRNWLTQTRFLWFPILMLTPLSLAILSILGYHYTAGLLTQRLLYSIWLLTGLLLAKDLFLRWIFMEKRRIAWQEAIKRRDEQRKLRSGEYDDNCESELAQLEEQDSVEFYEQVSSQAQHIISALLMMAGIIGFWWIWSDLLPALKFLDSVKLPFTTTELVDGIATEVPVTLADVGIGALVTIITILAAKNIPGLLEILLLQRLPIDAGARYAITTLSQYFIVAIGIIAAFSILGTQWSSIQWLVAALSVGLGFGLQEIVANFVSGIILLFERPIRVGDVVTIGNTTGTVSRIRIRATTIRDWEHQELLVPNKEFVTGRLLNWTLTDPINRITIDVGIAYGSDVTLALKLLHEAADEHPRILDDPAPLITFEQFGDSALVLRMRCYLDSMEFRTITRSEVNEIINRKFEEAGIVIAFPQTDVHLDTSSPLSIRIDASGADRPPADSA